MVYGFVDVMVIACLFVCFVFVITIMYARASIPAAVARCAARLPVFVPGVEVHALASGFGQIKKGRSVQVCHGGLTCCSNGAREH